MHLYPDWQDIQVERTRTTVSSWCSHLKGQEINIAQMCSVTHQFDFCRTCFFFWLVGSRLFCKVLLDSIIGSRMTVHRGAMVWTAMDCYGLLMLCGIRTFRRTSLLPRQLQKKVRRGHGQPRAPRDPRDECSHCGCDYKKWRRELSK